jgi:hypothetical protein
VRRTADLLRFQPATPAQVWTGVDTLKHARSANSSARSRSRPPERSGQSILQAGGCFSPDSPQPLVPICPTDPRASMQPSPVTIHQPGSGQRVPVSRKASAWPFDEARDPSFDSELRQSQTERERFRLVNCMGGERHEGRLAACFQAGRSGDWLATG